MNLNLNGRKYRYRPAFFRYEDELDVDYPQYQAHRYGEIYYENEWKKCHFSIPKTLGKTKIYISPAGTIKNRQSELGKVDSQGFFDIVELSGYNIFKIRAHDYFFNFKLWFLQGKDKATKIRRQLINIIIAVCFAGFYFEINYLFDNYLLKQINESNLIQSVIVFLSISSIVNIFHPFTLRKEVTLKEVDELILKRREELLEDFDSYKERYQKTKKFRY